MGEDGGEYVNLENEEPRLCSEGEQEANTGYQEIVVNLLDSVDSYIILFHSLSSVLRQGWLELASARHSMGTARINSTLFDLNSHNASASLNVNLDSAVTEMSHPNFTLCKWGSYDKHSSYKEAELNQDELLQRKSIQSELRCRGTSEILEKHGESNGSTLPVEDPIQKERSKSLSMFGTLVSPKLRAAQLSFETALHTLVKIANERSAMLSAYSKVQKAVESSRGH